MIIIIAFVGLGLIFGSFVNALVWRLREQSLPASRRQSKGKAKKKELSITKGRSMCPDCGHTLHAVDLVPVLSWLKMKGKCRYCKKPISWQYPIVELLTAALFVVSYFYWPATLYGWEWLSFGAWLLCIVGFMALIIYDLRWMILPNKIIFPLYGFAVAFAIARLVSVTDIKTVLNILLGIAVGGGIFYLLFVVSDGRWIGGGDVKLGFLLGALAGTPAKAALVLFVASAAGSLVTVPLTMSGKMNRNTRIPFGPLLIIGGIIVVLFGETIIDWYTRSIVVGV